MKRLTIAIPTYNAEKTIRRAIGSCSFVDMHEKDFEILLVDNCSTDETIPIIKEMKKTHKNIRLIQNKTNLGRIGNWNKCIEESRGESFIFLFTNDALHMKNDIKDCLEVMEKDPEVGLTMCRFEEVVGKKSRLMRPFITSKKKVSSERFIYDQLSWYQICFGPPHANIYKTKNLKKFRFKEEKPITADQVLTLEYALTLPKIYFSDKPLVRWIANSTRFHFQRNFLSYFKEEIDIINEIPLEINRRTFYARAHFNILYALLVGKLSWKEFIEAKKIIHKEREKYGVSAYPLYTMLNYFFKRYLSKNYWVRAP